ncbi:MAG: AIR synthase related protein, partial [Thermoplasmata archaeon]|nr:AIR synthase related protein [Thermoplasmata archaeon]
AAQPWTCRESARTGGAWVVEEAARNLYAVGAKPDAFTNCLNFGNPEDPEVMGDFSAVVRGMAEAAKAIGFSVPSGNVSFYNGGLGAEVLPTPVLMATGILEDLRHATTSDLKSAGNPLYLIGQSGPELGGSLYARRRSATGLTVPKVDPAGVRRAGGILLSAGRAGEVRSVHDVSDGGLAVTLSEMAFGGRLGFRADLAATRIAQPGVALVSEGGSRWVVEVSAGEARSFERRFQKVPMARLGSVTAARVGEFHWNGESVVRVNLPELYDRWRAGLGIP